MCGMTCGRYGLTLIALLGAVLAACQSTGSRPRPANVPQDAVRVVGGKSHEWMRCEYAANVNTCQIYNAGGLVLRDEIYRPYDGGDAVRAEDLKIDADESAG